MIRNLMTEACAAGLTTSGLRRDRLVAAHAATLAGGRSRAQAAARSRERAGAGAAADAANPTLQCADRP